MKTMRESTVVGIYARVALNEHNELEKQVLEQICDSCLVNEDTLIIVEASLQTDFSYLENLGLEMYREKRYKNNRHVFIQTQENEPA